MICPFLFMRYSTAYQAHITGSVITISCLSNRYFRCFGGRSTIESFSSGCWSWKNLNPRIKISYPDEFWKKRLNLRVEISPATTNTRDWLFFSQTINYHLVWPMNFDTDSRCNFKAYPLANSSKHTSQIQYVYLLSTNFHLAKIVNKDIQFIITIYKCLTY